MKALLVIVGSFCAGVIVDRYLTDKPIINLTFDPKIKVNIQNAHINK